jgi:hypothetical protein
MRLRSGTNSFQMRMRSSFGSLENVPRGNALYAEGIMFPQTEIFVVLSCSSAGRVPSREEAFKRSFFGVVNSLLRRSSKSLRSDCQQIELASGG